MRDDKKEALKLVGTKVKKFLKVNGVLLLIILTMCGAGMLSAITGAALVYLFWKGRKKKTEACDAQYRQGFEKFYGVQLTEKTLLRILVLEEMERRHADTNQIQAKRCRRWRTVLTVAYILLNTVLVCAMYYLSEIQILLTGLSVLYVYLFFKFDPVNDICKAAKNEPDKEITYVVSEMLTDEPRKPRVVLGVVAFVLCLAFAFIGIYEENFTFVPVEGGYSVTDYNPGISVKSDVEIPETYEGQPVVAIGKRAFSGMSHIEQIELPETVTLIDSFAFKDCSALQKVQLPAGLRTLNGESFKNCTALEEIIIPEGVTEIRGNTFEDCTGLKKVQLHNGIVDIHGYAFRNCSALEEIVLPVGITEIHAYTFENCTSLRAIHIPEGVTRIGAHAFYNCASLSDVYVPDSVQEIRSSAFRLCQALQEIVLPADTVVDERTFKESPTKVYRRKDTGAQQNAMEENGG